LLAETGVKSVTVAPETPSVTLMKRINKSFRAGSLVYLAERAVRAGIREMKLYYLIGLPGEDNGDVLSIVDEVRDCASVLPVRVTAGPLIPKASTPLQWAGMPDESALRKKWRALAGRLRRIPRVRVSPVSVREALVEATLARGDRRMLDAVIEGRITKEMKERYALRERSADEPFPWEHIVGVDRKYLYAEYERFKTATPTGVCRPATCRACGVCGFEGKNDGNPVP
jgi:radical SAM superfamily enzyme YgiQ (UPF0313 family)